MEDREDIMQKYTVEDKYDQTEDKGDICRGKTEEREAEELDDVETDGQQKRMKREPRTCGH